MTDKDKLLRVYDTSATSECPERIHDVIVDGILTRIKFTVGQPSILPYKVAMKFNQEGFIVTKNDDAETALVPPPETDETIRMRIGDDEVVAKYEELTTSALKTRAVRIPGGEACLSEDVKKQEVIAFLKAAANGELEVQIPVDPADDPLFSTEDADLVDLTEENDVPATIPEQPPVDNDHVEDGAIQFTEADIAANNPDADKETQPEA